MEVIDNIVLPEVSANRLRGECIHNPNEGALIPMIHTHTHPFGLCIHVEDDADMRKGIAIHMVCETGRAAAYEDKDGSLVVVNPADVKSLVRKRAELLSWHG